MTDFKALKKNDCGLCEIVSSLDCSFSEMFLDESGPRPYRYKWRPKPKCLLRTIQTHEGEYKALAKDFHQLSTDSAGKIEKLAQAIAFVIDCGDRPMRDGTIEELKKVLKEI